MSSGFGFALAGAAGATAMWLTMLLIRRLGLANADMIRALGSMVTRRESNAAPLGFVIHYSAGVFFAFLYAIILGLGLGMLGLDSFWILIGFMTVIGWGHGLIVGLVLMIAVAEHHPIPRFRNVGLGVAFAHVVGHAAYGLFFGLTVALLRVPLPRVDGGIAELLQEVLGYAVPWMLLFGAPLLFFLFAGLPWLAPRESRAP